jgi:plastocyanin
MTLSKPRFRRSSKKRGRPRWWLVLVPAVWMLFATVVHGGEIRGTIRIVTDVASPTMSAGLDPYAGTLNSVGTQSRGQRPRANTPKDVVVYLEGPGVKDMPHTSTDKPELWQINQSFEPHVLGVPVGATIEFPNGDLVYHNVFSYSKPKKFDLGYYGKGKSKGVTFDKPGLVQVFCDIHSTMSAYVLVVDTPFVTQPDENGEYVLPDVPNGNYTLKVWHPDLGDRSVKTTVGDGVTRLDVSI